MAFMTGSIVVDDGPEMDVYDSLLGRTTVRTLSLTWRGYRPELTHELQRVRGGSCYWDERGERWLIEEKLVHRLYEILAPTWWHVLWLPRYVANPSQLVRDLSIYGEPRHP